MIEGGGSTKHHGNASPENGHLYPDEALRHHGKGAPLGGGAR
jgi:hypothetical protein